jgi:prepilin peptidase CpaA
VSIAVLLACLYPIALFWAAVSDLTTMTIPNRLTIGLAVAFVPVALLMHLSLPGWGIHLGLGLAGLVLGMTLFAFHFMGGGDAKLVAAAAFWLGLDGFVALLVYTAIFGGLLTLTLVVLRRFFFLYAPKLPPWLGQHLEPKGGIPYGIAICAGGIAAIWRSDFLGFLVS